MTLHKLSAGTGYTYLTRQVAAHDRAERSQVGLAAYYEEKGESPGRWLGNGLAGLDLADGDVVTEGQTKLLFGQGRHPRSQDPESVWARPQAEEDRQDRSWGRQWHAWVGLLLRDRPGRVTCLLCKLTL